MNVDPDTRVVADDPAAARYEAHVDGQLAACLRILHHQCHQTSAPGVHASTSDQCRHSCMTMHDPEWLCRPPRHRTVGGNGVDLLMDGE
jgi:hypothetical protein